MKYFDAITYNKYLKIWNTFPKDDANNFLGK